MKLDDKQDWKELIKGKEGVILSLNQRLFVIKEPTCKSSEKARSSSERLAVLKIKKRDESDLLFENY